jgi:ribosomal protein L14E/L6E/L27E
MKHAVLTSEAAAIQRGAMETETILKNGASPKSLMSRGNFLKMLCGALFIAGVVFSGCKKDDDSKDDNLVSSPFDGTITATIEKGDVYNYLNSSISRVAAIAYYNDYRESEELASGTYANGSFTLTLPQQPDQKYLISAGGNIPDGVKVSDKNAKVLTLTDKGIVVCSSDRAISSVVYGKVDNNSVTMVAFYYADRDVTISGSYERYDEEYDEHHSANYSMSLKKGWNMVYITFSESFESLEATTKPVSGLKWYIEMDFEVLSERF